MCVSIEIASVLLAHNSIRVTERHCAPWVKARGRPCRTLRPERLVRFTATAQQHVAREKAWWLAHRDYVEVFAEELEQAIDVIALLPGAGAGADYVQSPVPGVRRVYLRRVDLHLYDTFDDREVAVRALWGARRRHRPDSAPNALGGVRGLLSWKAARDLEEIDIM
jgi:hypothetical protein